MVQKTDEKRSVQNELKTTKAEPSRRKVLRTVGATAAAGVGLSAFSSTAAADTCDETVGEPQVVFCGCSQLCWCLPFCSVGVVHTDEEWFAFTDGNVGLEPVGGPYETEFCYEIGDDVAVDVDGEKIIAFEVFNTDGQGGGPSSWEAVTIFENPNTCAQSAVADTDIEGRIDKFLGITSTTDGSVPQDGSGGCGTPPCDSPARDQEWTPPSESSVHPQ